MKKAGLLLLPILMLVALAGCNEKAIKEQAADMIENKTENNTEYKEEKTEMKLLINDLEIPVTWEENESVYEINEEVLHNDITVQMSMYGGNEQVGSLGRRYSSHDINTTTHNGDIVLYSSSNIVVFYGSNTWAYTRLGKMNLSESEVKGLLSNGDVTLTLTK